jgi:G:T/U-mismatch repair DNA glycosylase
MVQPQKEPMRALSEQEEQELQRRAQARLSVASGQPFTQAAQEAGLKSGDGVSKLVKRFNAHGLAALSIAAGRGRTVTYTSAERTRILAEVQREPDRDEDQTATWELQTLRRALRKEALEKKTDRAGMRTGRSVRHRAVERRRSWALSGHPAAGREVRSPKGSRPCSRTSTSAGAPPNC